MTVESIPKFTAPAAKLYAAIPDDVRKQLLSNVWCGKCRHEVTITNFPMPFDLAICCLSRSVQNATEMWRG